MTTLVLDTSAFIQGFQPSGAQRCYTVPEVKQEVRDEIAQIRIINAEATGALTVTSPDPRHVAAVEKRTLKMGESHTLSTTDKMVLALALQLHEAEEQPTVVSDDYSVQNMAEELGLKYRGLAEKGIKRRLTWVIYCPGCRRTYKENQPDGLCPICGTPLKKKPSKKRNIKRRGGE